MEIEQILAQFQKVKRAGSTRWRAVAPCHNGNDPQSLSITQYPDGVGFKCFVGCTQEEVTAAAGLKWQDLIPGYEDSTPEERTYARHANEIKRKQETADQHAIDAMASALERFWERDVEARLAAHVAEMTAADWEDVIDDESSWVEVAQGESGGKMSPWATLNPRNPPLRFFSDATDE